MSVYICAFCTQKGDASPDAPAASRVFRYGARHYAHAVCLVKNRGHATARALIRRDEVSDFDKAAKQGPKAA
jgi:hypothetical protein